MGQPLPEWYAKRQKPGYATDLTVDWAKARWTAKYRNRKWSSKGCPLSQEGYREACAQFAERKREQDSAHASDPQKPHSADYLLAIDYRQQVMQSIKEWQDRQGRRSPSLLSTSVAAEVERLFPPERVVALRAEATPESIAAAGVAHTELAASDTDVPLYFKEEYFGSLWVRMQKEIGQLNEWRRRERPPRLGTAKSLPIWPLLDSGNDWEDRLNGELLREVDLISSSRPPVAAGETVAELIDEYVQDRRRTARSFARDDPDSIPMGTAAAYAARLKVVREMFGNRSARSLKRDDLDILRKRLEADIDNKTTNLKRITARNKLLAAKAFFSWLDRKDDFLLKPLKSLRDISIYYKPRAPEGYSDSDLEAIFSAAEVERTKLFMLLGLNCGFLQKDIADLRFEEVDWQRGTIDRGRSKTGKEGYWLLWDETLRLLGKYAGDASTKGARVLLNQRGKPLAARQDGDTFPRTDAIRSLMRRLVDETGFTVSFKRFRTTSFQRIDSTYPHFSRFKIGRLFLANSGKDMADFHYGAVEFGQLEDVCRWLGDQYGFKTKRAIPAS